MYTRTNILVFKKGCRRLRYDKTFDDIEQCFDTIWSPDLEQHWYRKAWECLSNNGLTSYSSREEECFVYIRALVLNILYREFCQIELEEQYEYDGLYDLVENDLFDIEIGQLYGRYTDNRFIDIANYDGDGALHLLAETQKERVIDALKSELGDKGMFLGMYYTIRTPSNWYQTHEDEHYDSDSCGYEEYWKFVDSAEEDFRYSESDGYLWIEEALCIL